MLAFLANVSVLTALLFYFGWVRGNTISERLGISVSVFGLNTVDYVLRSVQSVLVLLLLAGAVGILWFAIDSRLAPWVRERSAIPPVGPDRSLRWALRAMASGVVVLPALVFLLAQGQPRLATVLWPVSLGLGVLLVFYAVGLHAISRHPDDLTVRRTTVLRGAVFVITAVTMFWTAANYASNQGEEFVATFQVTNLPGVVVTSVRPLHVDAPGVVADTLPGGEGDFRHRTRGLRLLEYTNGKYFLLSDAWTRDYGVLTILPEDTPGVRFDLVSGRRP